MLTLVSSSGSSPHTRGARDRFVDVGFELGIIPAYAGSTGPGVFDPPRGRDHPRIRGEHGYEVITPVRTTGSSPHTRGAHDPVEVDVHAVRIIPAYAGSTVGRRWRRRWRPDHPRIRGEHQHPKLPEVNPAGSSPHTRGALIDRLRDEIADRIIPAYAGSTSPAPAGQGPAPDHPRIRGEHVVRTPEEAARGGSSPHTRGAPLRPVPESLCRRIIPAYAGSTARAMSRQVAPWDHPRIRGEHQADRRGGAL